MTTRTATKCQSCDGTGWWVLMRSWFAADGYRKCKCHICDGSGINPPGYVEGVAQRATQAQLRAAAAASQVAA